MYVLANAGWHATEKTSSLCPLIINFFFFFFFHTLASFTRSWQQTMSAHLQSNNICDEA